MALITPQEDVNAATDIRSCANRMLDRCRKFICCTTTALETHGAEALGELLGEDDFAEAQAMVTKVNAFIADHG